MKMNSEDGIERQLNRLAPRPVPPGLRERVLSSALKVRGDAALTPGMKLAALGCVVLIVAVLGIGSLVGNREAARLAVLLDGRPGAGEAGKKTAGELAEMAGLEGGDAERMIKLLALASSAEREERQGRLDAALMRPRGWSENETFQDLN